MAQKVIRATGENRYTPWPLQPCGSALLYHLYDLQRAAMEPWGQLARTLGAWQTHPANPLASHPAARHASASLQLFERLAQRYKRPAFGIDSVRSGAKMVAVREEIVAERTFCRLRHFGKAGIRPQPKVLLCAPLSGHFATLLRDTVRTFLADHDVWITDWNDAKEVPTEQGAFTFDDYVGYVREFLALLGPELHVVSVCQPAVPVLAALALDAVEGRKPPRSVTLIGGPVDTRVGPTAVSEFSRTHPIEWFESHVIQRVPWRYPGHMRRVYPGFLQFAGFVAMNPMRHADSHAQFWNHLVEGDGEGADAHRRFYDEYNAVMDLPAEYYLDTIERVFHRHALPKGDLVVSGERVRLEKIKGTSLLTIEGELDDISGPGQTMAALDLCRGISESRKSHFTAPGVGHFGIFSGRAFRERIYPRLRVGLAQREGGPRRP